MGATQATSATMTEQAARSKAAVREMFDPYALMDRLDEEALLKEMEGQSVEELVYRFTDKKTGKEIIGLSKVGVDECCIRLMKQGQCIREEKISHTFEGKGEERAAFFQARCARYAVSPEGTEVRLDQVIGVKRQALYGDAGASLSLDDRIGFGKHKELTWREALSGQKTKGWVEWASTNLTDERKQEFCRRILDGEDVMMEGGRQLNTHWFEQGSMKAARNGRFRLIPLEVRHDVIEMAKEKGKVRDIQAPGTMAPGERAAEAKASGPQLVTLLPGSDKNWDGWGGRLIGDVPSPSLLKARHWYQEKGPQKNARLIEAIDLELEQRRLAEDAARPDPTDPATFEQKPEALEAEDGDLPGEDAHGRSASGTNEPSVAGNPLVPR